jgi:transposase
MAKRFSAALSPDEIQAAADRADGSKPTAADKGAGGRPTAYQATYAKQAAKLCGLGATDEDLAEFFEVSIRTIARWKTKHEEFCQALKEGKSEADDRVERSLYQRATGYTHDAEKIFNNQGEILRAGYREHYPPDTTAAIFWLKNRRPEQWREKQQLEHTGKDGGPIEVEEVSARELVTSRIARLTERGGQGEGS